MQGVDKQRGGEWLSRNKEGKTDNELSFWLYYKYLYKLPFTETRQLLYIFPLLISTLTFSHLCHLYFKFCYILITFVYTCHFYEHLYFYTNMLVLCSLSEHWQRWLLLSRSVKHGRRSGHYRHLTQGILERLPPLY